MKIAFLIIALVGLLDSLYLTFFRPVSCSLGHCDLVLSSPYAILFGMPLGILGIIYYGIILALSLDKIKRAALLTPIGFIASAYFVFLQLFIIKAICWYCMLSALSSALLFILGLWVLLRRSPSTSLEPKPAPPE